MFINLLSDLVCSLKSLYLMADESKLIHLYYNIGCKWRYKQMRYDECNQQQNCNYIKNFKIQMLYEFFIQIISLMF